MKIRIKFSKQGAMKFIGHLDMMRYFQKAMRRAEVDICYSEGFSPHQIMSFAAPLGVGLTSRGEYLDIEVASSKDSKTMITQLNHVMAEGIEVKSYRKLDDSAKNAMSIVAAADYTVLPRNEAGIHMFQEFSSHIDEFISQREILIIKKTKKSEKEMDIKPMIQQMEIRGDAIFMRLSTGSSENLKPELVLDAFRQYLKLPESRFAFQIQREEVYGLQDQTLISLEDLGEDIE